MFVIRAFSVIRHRCFLFVFFSILPFFLLYPKIAILPNHLPFSLNVCSFRLSRSGTAIGLSHRLSLFLLHTFSSSYPGHPLFLFFYLSSSFLFTSFYSSIIRKSTALSARRSSSIVLFQAAVESTFFLWSLGFYSVSCLQLARSSSLALVSFSLSLPIYLFCSPSLSLCLSLFQSP